MKNPLSRRLFFWFLVFSFFISTTLTLFFSFGYRFDWEKKIFIHSGSITIKSNPVKIEIKIDGKKLKANNSVFTNNSYQINGLRPGFYDLEISAQGFNTWSKKVSVNSNISTELWNVLLTRNNYERKSFNFPKIDNFFPAPKEFIFAYTSQQNENLELGVFNTEKNEILNKIVLENIKFTNNEFENIEWSPNNDALIAPVLREFEKEDVDLDKEKITFIEENKNLNEENLKSEKFKDYLIFNLENNDYFYLSDKVLVEIANDFSNKFEKGSKQENVNVNEMLSSLSDEDKKEIIFAQNFSSVRWSPKEKNSIYFLLNKKFYLANFDFEKKEILKNSEIYSGVLAYDFADDGIYILDKKGQVFYNRDFDLKNLENLTTFEIGENAQNLEFRLDAYDKDRIILLENKENNFYIYNKIDGKIYTKKMSGILNAYFSNDGKKIAFHSISEIFVYFTRNWETQPFRNENDLRSITLFSKKISNLHFTKDYEHLIFSAENEIKIIEIYDKGEDNLQTITDLKTNKTKIISDHRNDILYFLDEENNLNSNFFQINFPEEIPILNLVD